MWQLDFEIVNFPFLDGDVPRSTSYGVYISQIIRFARASSYVADFNTRNKLLTQNDQRSFVYIRWYQWCTGVIIITDRC